MNPRDRGIRPQETLGLTDAFIVPIRPLGPVQDEPVPPFALRNE